MRKDEFIGQKFHWFTGEIVDIDDDQKFNRVRVYCHGYHDQKFKEEKNKESLPWAIVMMPTTSAGTPNVGANHHLEVGSWVVGFFRDGESAQDPIVMGSITSSTDGKSDLYEAASTTNKIYRSKAGHKIELENKEDDETITVTHAKGAQIIIDKDNNIAIVTEGKLDISAVGELKFFSSKKTIIV